MSRSSKQEESVKQKSTAKPKLWLWILGIVLVTLISYSSIFSEDKQFTNWDDDQYITNQPLITSLSGDTVLKLFNPSTIVIHNYHPVTMVSLAVDYQQGHDEDVDTLSIAPFVRTNLLFHLLNSILVFLFIYQLSNKKIVWAAITATLFGIHPMHIESVAWMSERKDVLYCFFFLLSSITYLRYLTTQKLGFLGLSILLFVASCLCKAMAVPLPFVLLLIDYLYHRELRFQLILEKIPYLLCALIVGLHTLAVQQGAMADGSAFSLVQRFLFVAGAYCLYWIKLLLPFHLSAYYPYPDVLGGHLPVFYYLAPILALIISIIPVIWVRVKSPGRFRAVVWGIGFFVLMIALVLPVMMVGTALIADRYTYVSSIGLFFLVPVLLQNTLEHGRYRKIVFGIIGAVCLFYAMQTHRRISVWENSKTLWTDVLEQYPLVQRGNELQNAGVKTAYKNLADYFASENQYDSAFLYYQPLIAADTKDAEVWSNVANVYVVRKDTANALKALNKSIALDSTSYETYLKRAIVLANTNNYPEAVKNLDKVLMLHPADSQTRSMRLRMIDRIRK